ncbi:MAG: hypothetical protein V3V33_15000 [Candidatus Lokiarchaeia archaeon]
MNRWKIIAKNEIRIKTSRFRKHRRFYLLLIFSISLYWGLFFGPFFIDAIIPDTIKEFSSQIESLVVQIIEFTFTSFFLISIMYPLFVLFRKTEIERKDIILSSPIEPRDIILGDFLGQAPFYLLFILIIGPFGITIVSQISSEMNLFHCLIFYLCFFVLYMFGSLIGVVLSNWIETRILIRDKLKNPNKSLILLISVLVITIFYSFHFIFNLIRVHPELKPYFLFYPSFWYSSIVLFCVNYSFAELYFLNIFASIILGIIVPTVFFYIFYKKASVFYDFKLGAEKQSKTFRQNRLIHKYIKKITHKNYKELIIFQFKAFLRKRENLMKLIYIIGTISVLGVVTYNTFEGVSFSLNIGSFGFPINFQIRFDKNLIAIILSWMGGLIFGLLMGMYDFLESKELLFTYKRSPKGLNVLIYSYIYKSFYILIIYAIALTFFFTIILKLEILVSLSFFFGYIINSVIILLQSIGVQCFRPRFGERRKNLVINNYLILFFQIISFLLTLFIFILPSPGGMNPYLGLIFLILINLGISGLIASILFYLGIKKLNRIE